jgi:ornithine cyclodeaminase
MTGHIDFVPLAASRALVATSEVVARIEQAYRWVSEGLVIACEPAAIRMESDVPRFKSHAKAVIIPPLGIAGLRCVGYAIAPDGSGPSSDASTRLVVLMDLATGSPVAIVDEHHNYTLRTAASVAVAAKHLHPERPRLGLIGAGGVAGAVAKLFAAVLPLEGIVVTSRRSESRERLARDIGTYFGGPVEVADTADRVLDTCNVIVTATTTKVPLVARDRMRPGTLYCALGSFELAGEIYRDADRLFVDDWRQTRGAHDIKPLLAQGLLTEDALSGELADVVAGRIPGRRSAEETIVVRTEGMAVQDIVLAHWTWRAAREVGMVTAIPV